MEKFSKYITLLGALGAMASAIAPQVTTLSPQVGAILSIIGVALAAFGPALVGPRGFNSTDKQDDSDSSRYHSLALLALPCLASLVLIGTACDQNQFRRAARSSSTIAQTVSVGVDVKRQMRSSGDIDDAEELNVTRGMLDFTHALHQLNDTALNAQVYDGHARAALLEQFNLVNAAATQLLADGTLHIKNQRARERLSLALYTARVSLPIIQSLLEKDGPAAGVPIASGTRLMFEQSNIFLREAESKLQEDLQRLDSVPAQPASVSQ